MCDQCIILLGVFRNHLFNSLMIFYVQKGIRVSVKLTRQKVHKAMNRNIVHVLQTIISATYLCKSACLFYSK